MLTKRHHPRATPFVVAAALWLSCMACSDDVELLVELRTDFVPGIEFTGVQVELFRSPPSEIVAPQPQPRLPVLLRPLHSLAAASLH